MKIAMISGEYPPMPGGVGDFTRILAEQLAAMSNEVALLSRAGTVSDSLPLSAVDNWGIAGLRQIRAWLRAIKPDIVNLQFQTAAYDMSPWLHFLPRFVDAPLVTTFHDLRYPYLFPKAGGLRDWIVMRLARTSTGCICTNHEDYARLASLPRRRLIPIGSSVSRHKLSEPARQALRAELGADDTTFLLGHFGFVKAIKGVDALLEALARIRDTGSDARLVFIGGRSNTVDADEDQRYLRHVEARLHELELDERVSWTGFLPAAEVAARMQAVDLMVLPFSDGASYRRSSLIAAIHQGCAVLSTEPAIDIDSFRHGRNLWLVKRECADSLESGLAQLMASRQTLERLREGALALSRDFAWPAIAKDTLDFYRACL